VLGLCGCFNINLHDCRPDITSGTIGAQIENDGTVMGEIDDGHHVLQCNDPVHESTLHDADVMSTRGGSEWTSARHNTGADQPECGVKRNVASTAHARVITELNCEVLSHKLVR